MNLNDHPAVAAVLAKAATALASRGYRRHEHSLAKQAPHGDWVSISLEDTGFGDDATVTFRVTVVVVPQPWLAWLRAEADATSASELVPVDGDAMAWERPQPQHFS